MCERVSPSSDSPPPAFKPTAAPVLNVRDRMPINSSSPSLAGRATSPSRVSSEAPKNDPNEIARYKTDIEWARDIPSLESILSKLRKRDISNNPEKLILVAECFIGIHEFKLQSSNTPLTNEEYGAPLKNLEQAFHLLEICSLAAKEKLYLLTSMVRLYERIQWGSPDEKSEGMKNCQILANTARIQFINELILKNDRSSIVSACEELGSFEPSEMSPGQKIALIPIYHKMMIINGADRRDEFATRATNIIEDTFTHIKTIPEAATKKSLFTSLIEELEKILMGTNLTIPEDLKKILNNTLVSAKRELRTLEPKLKLTPLTITLMALGVLAFLSLGGALALLDKRHWSKA